MAKVVVVDDKQSVRDSVIATLARAGMSPVSASDGPMALEMIRKHRPAAVVTDLKMPGMDGLDLLEHILKADPDLPVVLMTAYATVETAVLALKRGAFDYIQKPFEGDEMVMTIKRAVAHHELVKENRALKQNEAAVSTREMVGRSDSILRLREQVEQIAASHGTVLISGESGTGKEVVARMIHALSPRRANVMLCLNCAALSSSLLESELFGHEKGAFTGADQMRKGRFELAEGGSLLLDEISEISPQVQAKLLRVLQERQFERVGSSVTMGVDVRIIATTNRELKEASARGEFREDLYFRLNVLPLRVPTLRTRKEDIPLLAAHFMKRQAARDGGQQREFSPQAMALLMEYNWPGNVRELENICERAAVLAGGRVVEASTIQPWLEMTPDAASDGTPQAVIAGGQTLEEFERQVILKTLGRFSGHRQRTARALGIGVRTLGLKLKKWKEQHLVAEGV